jgi:NADPH:quinone reductase-like Zn-dependent oxidoreductase
MDFKKGGSSMKAVQYKEYGGSEVLEIEELTLAEPEPNQILVEVRAAAINPFDTKLLSGTYKENIPLQFPATPGGDFAGKVIKTGADVTGLKEGEDIYGTAMVLSGGTGAFAEMALVKAAHAAPMPQSADYEEAAASVLVGVSAIQALEEHMELRSGQKILIHGAAGGIGHMAVQLAKSIGAYVSATASGEDAEYVIQLGADQVIDYKAEAFEDMVKDFDAVYDTVGGEVTKKSFTVLKKGGILVSMKGKPDEERAKKVGVRVVGQGTRTNRKRLDRLTELIDGGKIKVRIDRLFPLDKVREAFDRQTEGHPRSKVVLKIVDKPKSS